jgi:hypothetical protein
VPVLDVPVDAVVGDVELAADEPLRERRVGPVEDLGPLLRPGQPLGLLGPEGRPVGIGLLVDVGRQVGVRLELIRRREAALLVGQIGECFGHVVNLFR